MQLDCPSSAGYQRVKIAHMAAIRLKRGSPVDPAVKSIAIDVAGEYFTSGAVLARIVYT